MPDINTTLRFNADITDFKGAMSEANRSIKLANSEFKAAASGMDNWASSTDGLKAKLQQLANVQAAEERRLAVLKNAYAEVVKEQGENSAAAQDLQTKINNQQAAVNKVSKDYRNFSAKLDEVENAAEDAGDALEDVGDSARKSGQEAEDAGGGWTIFKDVVADFVSNIVQNAVDSLLSAAEATREYRREMAQLAQNASDSGHDMKAMKDTLADVAAVTGETDAAMEGLNMLMATKLDTKNLEMAAEAFAGAATKFDGLKFEGLAEGLQESLAVGQAVGPFAELIERTGGDLEKFNEGLAACTTEAAKQEYTMKWLADSGLKSVHDSYVQNNADLVEAEKAQFRHNEAMAKMGAVLEPIETALTNMKATIAEKLAPVVQNIIQWVKDNLPIIEPIVIALAAALGVLAAALAIQGIIKGVSTAFSLLNATMLANPIVLIVALLAALVAAFIHLWNNCEEFRVFFENLWAGIKRIVKTGVEYIVNTFNDVVAWVKGLPKKIGTAISGAISTVATWGTNLYNTAKAKISQFVSGVFSWASQIPGKIGSAISGAISAVATWGQNLWQKGKEAASKLISSVVDGVSSLPGKLLDVGKNLVSGLWNGISSSVQWLKDKISGWVGDVLGFMKRLFGINSPSKETGWQGKMLVAGYVDALKNGKKDVEAAMRGLGESGLDGLNIDPRAPGGAAAGGKQIIINQVNNSPKALSRREIYRQTHNALAYAGGA